MLFGKKNMHHDFAHLAIVLDTYHNSRLNGYKQTALRTHQCRNIALETDVDANINMVHANICMKPHQRLLVISVVHTIPHVLGVLGSPWIQKILAFKLIKLTMTSHGCPPLAPSKVSEPSTASNTTRQLCY